MAEQAPRRILIVDDEPNHRRMLNLVLSNKGYAAEEAPTAVEALGRLSNTTYDFILLDLRMPGMDGMQFLREFRRLGYNAIVVIMTAYAEVQTAVEAMKLGAADYLTKPLDVEEMLGVLDRAETPRALAPEIPPSIVVPADQGRYGMIGQSQAMRQVYSLIERVAPTEATVLITGESGTGKELVARAIHEHSARNERPLLSLNCAALPETLLESELFGHTKGAFTGADRSRAGRFEAANGGTLFLDEIGDLHPAAQAKMLRVLQEGTFEPIGSNETKQVDVRLIAATHCDLQQAVSEQSFRQDLFYRLNIVSIPIAPLRERPGDIESLANHFVQFFALRNRKKIRSVSSEFLHALVQHDWPGNVRELENVIERCVILALTEELTPDLLPFKVQPSLGQLSSGFTQSGRHLSTLQGAERDIILRTMEACHNNQSEAARQLGISRQTLINKLKQYRS